MQFRMFRTYLLQFARTFIDFMQITRLMALFLYTVQITDLSFCIVQLARSSIKVTQCNSLLNRCFDGWHVS